MQLLAEGRCTEAEIADALEVSPRTVRRWKTEPALIDQVYEAIRQTRNELQKKGVRERNNRLSAIDAVVEKIQAVIAARAALFQADPLALAQGAGTGIVVKRMRTVGSGDSAEIIEEYEVDVAPLRELREQLKQAAIEVGEWAEKRLFGGVDNQLATGEMQTLIAKAYGVDEDEADEPTNVQRKKPTTKGRKPTRKTSKGRKRTQRPTK